MAHKLRKYLSSRGSALFMVLSTMTALLIVAMAMYFSVVSSRSVQYAVFNQQQSYQSASSISDVLLSGLKDGSLASGSNDLLSALDSMNIGDTISTGDNGFVTLGATGGGARSDEDQVGAYSVDITRLNDEEINGDQNKTFDIATTTYVNGVAETVHTFVHVKLSSIETDAGITQVFASTGYVPNDTYLEGGQFLTDVFFDNENTVINAYGGKGMEFTGNLYCGGSLTMHSYIAKTGSDPVVWAIRNKLTIEKDCNTAMNLHGGVVLVGGDLVVESAATFTNADVYVNGDVYIKGATGLSQVDNLFVNGNIYVDGGIWCTLKNVYYSDTTKIFTGNFYSPVAASGSGRANEAAIIFADRSLTGNFASNAIGKLEKWDGSYGMNYDDFITTLDESTSTCTYYKWVINDGMDDEGKTDKDLKKLPSYVSELDTASGTDVHKTFRFNLGNMGEINGIPQQTFVQTVEYEKDTLEGFIVDDVICEMGNTTCNHMAIIIDTGDDPDNVMTIRVTANRDYDGDGVKESFSWYPFETFNSSAYMSVLVKGRGSLVVDIPPGVTYQDERDVVFMHYNWFTLLGGTIGSSGGVDYYNSSGVRNGSTAAKAATFVHSDCCASGDACTYTEKTLTEKCKTCGEKMHTVTCSVHQYEIKFCPKCNPEKVTRDADDKPTQLCNNRVDRQAIDTYLASNPTIAANMEKDTSGALVYPTANIFLVSCEESASIRLSKKANGTTIMQNAFFGYIYAPYMTFKAYGDNAGGGYVRFFGGLTVSDYIIDDSMSFLACWPEKLPTELMGQECFDNQLDGIASKGWKITLGSH
ncbi:MAG: hypothetical protein ACI4XA_06695 [Oscillospiraceae bacterium]